MVLTVAVNRKDIYDFVQALHGTWKILQKMRALFISTHYLCFGEIPLRLNQESSDVGVYPVQSILHGSWCADAPEYTVKSLYNK